MSSYLGGINLREPVKFDFVVQGNCLHRPSWACAAPVRVVHACLREGRETQGLAKTVFAADISVFSASISALGSKG